MDSSSRTLRKSRFRLLAGLLRPRAAVLIGSLLAAWAGMVADLLQPMPLKLIIDNVLGSRAPKGWLNRFAFQHWGSNTETIIVVAAVGAVLIAVLGAVCSYFEKLATTSASQWVMHDLRAIVYSRIQRLSLAWHDQARTGDLMTRVTGDIDAVQSFITSALLKAITSVMLLIFMATFMFATNVLFALIALSITPVLAVIALRYSRRLRKSAREVRQKQGEIASRIQETFSSIRVVKAFAREDFEEQRLHEESLESVNLALRVRKVKARLSPVVDVVVALSTSVVLWYGARLILHNEMEPGSLIVFLAYMNKMYKPMQDLAKMSDDYTKATVGWERVRDVIEADNPVADLPHARQAPKFGGEIEFDNVSFSYNPGEPVLKNIRCSIHAGQVTAIVGPTGAGKTSLIGMIPRFYDPSDGSVKIDGHDVREFTQKSLRDQISLVSQESILFRTSILDNISYGSPGASKAQIVRAAEMANAAEFIERMPERYESIVGERGMTLSGGQRQRLAIARAIIRNTPILILDEPSSGLDAASERLVFEALDRLMQGKTSIVIAHRLSTVRRADVIYVMKDGAIVEQGSHQDLVGGSGLYAELCRIQFGPESEA